MAQYRAEYKKRLELEELLPVCAWTKQIRWNG